MVSETTRSFSSDGFMPHGMCYLWQPDILALHFASDLLIALAYFSIPFTLLYFVRKRRDLEFNWMFVCFAVFIVACGTTHLMEIWVIWHPVYWLSGAIKALTALASVPTAVLLVALVPAALRLPSPATMRDAHAALENEIAERRVAEAQLRSVNERLTKEAARGTLAAIVESSDDAIISKTCDGIITSWNQGAERIFGYTNAEAIGRSATMLFPADRIDEETDILRRIRVGARVANFETVRVRKDGLCIDVSATISPIRDADGSIVGASKIARDITERKRTEQKLTAQLARVNLLHTITQAIGERQDLASIFQVVISTLEDHLPIDFGCLCLFQPPDTLSVAGLGGKSQPLAIDLGMTEQALLPIDRNGLARCARGELVYEPDLQAMLCPFPQRLFGVGLRAMVACPLLVEGRVFGVLITARRVARSFSNGECEFLGQLCAHVALAARQTQLYAALQVAYEDLRHTQQAIMRQEKLRVLGQMASGIAHDINNALSPAALYVELLLDHPTTQSTEAQDYLVIIQRAINGVAQTVARMKEFYGQRDPDRAQNPVSLNRAVEQVLALTRVRWHSMPQEAGVAIEVDTQLSPHLPAIIGDENEIRDAVTNLIINAVDAMPEGGRLSLCTHAADGGRAIVEVTDTGTGMDEATRSRCLELFFTTKGVRGTGLGLAMVYGAVERHGGELQIESAPGAGTTVRLIFPVATPRSSENVDCMTDVRPLKPLHILVVDDDPIVLQSLRTTLEQDGHVVESADGGQRGIDAFSAAMARQQPFSVVITDLGMPLVDGRAVAVAIKSMRSITRVVLLTGWGHRLLTEREVPQSVDRVLAKPPQLTRLRALLAELTNQASV